MKKLTLWNFACRISQKNWWNFYIISENWHDTTLRHDRDENPKKTAMENLIYAYSYRKKYDEMLKIYKKTNDYGLAWKMLEKSEIYEQIENEKKLLLANL